MPSNSGEKIVTVHDLIDDANAAIARMGNSNPNKKLVYLLGSALSSLSGRYTELTEKNAALEAKIAEGEADAQRRVTLS